MLKQLPPLPEVEPTWLPNGKFPYKRIWTNAQKCLIIGQYLHVGHDKRAVSDHYRISLQWLTKWEKKYKHLITADMFDTAPVTPPGEHLNSDTMLDLKDELEKAEEELDFHLYSLKEVEEEVKKAREKLAEIKSRIVRVVMGK